MRKLIESTFVSLDGVIGSPEKWTTRGLMTSSRSTPRARLVDIDALLLGRRIYEKWAINWSLIKGDEYFDRINALPKFVASTSLRETTRGTRRF